MKRVIWSIVLTLIVTLPTSIFASENLPKQISAIISFYEMLSQNKRPTVSDFFKLFGKNNESELQLILRKQFPSVDWKQNWSSNREALDYVNNVYDHSSEHTSLFLQCLQVSEPKLFAETLKGQIEFPPRITKEFTIFTVAINSKKILFEFSQKEAFIENIYLPNGRSIYTLIERCVK